MSVRGRTEPDPRDVYEARLNAERRRLGEQEALQEERRAREAAEARLQSLEDLQRAREALDARARHLEALLRAHGIEVPDPLS
jgi:hypothetical protein